LAEGFLDLEQSLVVPQGLLAITFLHALVGVEQEPAVHLLLLLDAFLLAGPLESPTGVDLVSEILVRLEPLQGPPDLAGQLLGVHLFAADRGQAL
jgi:hypothetical protein